MHELGIVVHIVKTVEDFADENKLTRIAALILQIGELSGVVPKYIEDCYAAVVDGTWLQETRLGIEILPGRAVCKGCSGVFNPLQHNYNCPECGTREWEVISGQEFLIKEVIAC